MYVATSQGALRSANLKLLLNRAFSAILPRTRSVFRGRVVWHFAILSFETLQDCWPPCTRTTSGSECQAVPGALDTPGSQSRSEARSRTRSWLYRQRTLIRRQFFPALVRSRLCEIRPRSARLTDS